MSARDTALAIVEGLLARVVAEQAPDCLLTPDAVKAAEGLLAATETRKDPAAARALGWFHWNRYLVLADGTGEDGLIAAFWHFGTIVASHSDLVPEPMHDFYRRNTGSVADIPTNPNAVGACGVKMFAAYNVLRDRRLLAAALAGFRGAVLATSREHPDYCVHEHSLGLCLQELFEHNGRLVTLTAAVESGKAAVDATPLGHPGRAHFLSSLGRAQRMLFDATQEVGVLVAAVHTARQAVAAASVDDDFSEYLNTLGSSLRLLYECVGDRALLDEATTVLRRSLAVLPLDHPDHGMRLHNMSIALHDVFERIGDRSALDEAVETGRAAVAATADDHANRAGRLTCLGNGLLSLFECTEDKRFLVEALGCHREALAAVPVDHADRGMCLNNLGLALRALFETDNREATLAEAVYVARDALATAPADHPDHVMYSCNLGSVLQMWSDRYERFDPEARLAEAVQLIRDAIAAAPTGHPSRAKYLHNLSSALLSEFDRVDVVAVLEEAVQAERGALAIIPVDHAQRATYLNSLGGALLTMFERTGRESTLEEALQVGRAAVAAVPVGSRHRAGFLTNLGSSLRLSYELSARRAVLMEAVEVARAAVEAASGDSTSRPMFLSHLGLILRVLYDRDGQEDTLAEAIEHLHTAMTGLPSDAPIRATVQNNLGIALMSMFERTPQKAILEEAVVCLRAAVAETPAGHSELAVRLSNLSSALQRLFILERSEVSLAESERSGRAAVSATSVGRPARAAHLFSLGNALHLRFLTFATADALAEARQCFTEAAIDEAAPSRTRILAYRAQAALPGDADHGPDDDLAAIEAAIELLPQTAPRALLQADRQHSLGRLSTLAAQAAATATAAGRPDRAVELLEQTRGVMVADTLDARSSDLTRLRERDSVLAEAFVEIRARVDALDHSAGFAPRSTDTVTGEAHLVQARLDAHRDWDRLTAAIRAIDGFEGFLRVPDIRDLSAHAQDGPVVFVYADSKRSDALILTRDEADAVQVVPLPGLSDVAATVQADRLLTARHVAGKIDVEPMQRIAAQTEISEVLEWLWDVIAEPVLTALGHLGAPVPDRLWPRVHWCPIGVLAYLPLHAAGHHRDINRDLDHHPNRDLDPDIASTSQRPRTVMDRVVSSYTTTLRGLGYSRIHPTPDRATTLVVVAPDPPNLPYLPGVTAETADLVRLLPDAPVLPHPTRDEVLATLPGHPAAHFACHGQADWANPTAGRLMLYDHETTPLTVTDISALNLTGALAYLSACETTVTNPALTNEAVHITGAFHLAGYAHVIGTLWRVDDAAAASIAHDFYSMLTGGGTGPLDTRFVPQALHEAVRRLRDLYPATPTFWAAHIHTGC